MAVAITWRVLSAWPANYPQTKSWQRPRCPFKSLWSKTLDDLRPRVASRGRAERGDRGGKERLIFPCDTFSDWQDNVRAIALTLNALRMMERYGTTSGRQYQGFKALPSQGSTTTTTEAALATIRRYAPHTNGAVNEQSIRVAKAAAHPDRGGSHEAFVAVAEAEKALRAAGVLA